MSITDKFYEDFPYYCDSDLCEAYARNVRSGRFMNAWDILQVIRRKFAERFGNVLPVSSRWEYVRGHGKIIAFECELKG